MNHLKITSSWFVACNNKYLHIWELRNFISTLVFIALIMCHVISLFTTVSLNSKLLIKISVEAINLSYFFFQIIDICSDRFLRSFDQTTIEYVTEGFYFLRSLDFFKRYLFIFNGYDFLFLISSSLSLLRLFEYWENVYKFDLLL